MSDFGRFIEAFSCYAAASMGIPFEMLISRIEYQNMLIRGHAVMRQYSQAGPWAAMLKGKE